MPRTVNVSGFLSDELEALLRAVESGEPSAGCPDPRSSARRLLRALFEAQPANPVGSPECDAELADLLADLNLTEED